MDELGMDTSQSLIEDKLSVCAISQETVDELWETNFCDSDLSLAPNHQVYQPAAWQDFIAFCLSCREGAAGVWNTLMRGGVPHCAITAAVFLSVCAGGPADLGLTTCLGYVCILSFEGANIYKLFHPVVFQKCLDLVSASAKWEKSRKKVPLCTQEEDLEMDIECVNDSWEEASIDELEIVKRILVEMGGLLKSFRFQLHMDSLLHLISSLFSIICRYPMHTDPGQVNYLAWNCVGEVHKSLHGDEKEILSDVIKHLLPLLIFKATQAKSSSTVSKSQLKLCEQAVSYLRYLLETGLMEREARITFIVVPRHLCLKCPVQTQYKAKGSKVVRELVSYLPDTEFSAFFRWFSSVLSSRRHEHRNMSVSVALEFILAVDKDCEVTLDSESQDRSSLCAYLLDCIIQRCSDSVSPVRANALQSLSELSTNTKLPHIQESIRNLATASNDSANPLLSMLASRLSDQKASVRKNALLALEGTLRLLPSDVITESVRIVRQRTFDVSLSVRKQAILSLKELLLAYQESRPIQALFLSGLLPLVIDPESSVQERCVDILFEELFSQLSPYKSSRDQFSLSWSLLSQLCEEGGSGHEKYFLLLLHKLSKDHKLSKQLIGKLFTYTASSDHLNCWRLLSLLSQQTEGIEVDKVYSCWKRAVDTPEQCQGEILSMIRILSNLYTKLSEIQSDVLKVWLSEELEKCTMNPDKINIYVNALILLCQQSKSNCKRHQWFSGWAGEMIRKSSLFVKDWFQQKAVAPEDDLSSEDRLVTYLSLLGELITVCPNKIDPDIPPLIQWALIQKPGLNPDTSLHSITLDLSPRLRAFICILFGKLCLVQQDLAYDSANLLAEELFTSHNVPIKNNIIIVLCDLCVRYPNLIENYLSHISPCLRDESYVVRRQTLTLLTQLIQEDYIKLKGSLIYHLLAVINDNELRELVQYCLKHVLLKKYPRSFYHHFIESIFYFQHNCNHPSFNQFPQTEMETERFSLPGAHNTKKRFAIYNYMLEQLNDEQRFNLSGRIVQEVLGSIMDKVLKLEESNYLLIADVLSILCSDEIKLSSVKTHSVENLEDDEREAMEAAVNLQNDVIKKLVKKDVIENIIPTIIGMKRLLQKDRSPLLSNLMGYLYRLKDDFKDKFAEVLSGDKQLAEEIEFDIKRYEEDLDQANRSFSMRASLTAAEVALANPNFSPAVLLSPHSISVTKTLREVRIRSCVGNSPSVLHLNRLASIRSESRRKVISPLSIAHHSPIVNEIDGSPELTRKSHRQRNNKAQERPRDDAASKSRSKEKAVSFLISPPSVEQDVLMNSFVSPPPNLNTSLSAVNSSKSKTFPDGGNVISFSPTDESTTRQWNLTLREHKKK